MTRKRKSEPLKVPVQLVKRMGDGPIGEMRWQIEVPEQLLTLGSRLEVHKQKFFVLVGPFETEEEIRRYMEVT